MTVLTAPTAKISRPTFGELFTPKLVTILREGYDLSNLRSDAIAGLTVAIVALPLSMSIAIASATAAACKLIATVSTPHSPLQLFPLSHRALHVDTNRMNCVSKIVCIT